MLPSLALRELVILLEQENRTPIGKREAGYFGLRRRAECEEE